MRVDQSILGPSQFESRLPWGPFMALVLTVAVIGMALVASDLAARIGLLQMINVTTVVNLDGTTTITGQSSLQRAQLVQYLVGIPLLLLAASRLRTNPLDALALRLPTRLGRALLIVVALLVLEYALRFAQAALWDLWAAAGGTSRQLRVSSALKDAITREGLMLSIAGTAILGPVAEELIFRGMLLQSLAKTRVGFWGGAILVTLPFAAIHAQQYGSILNVSGILFTGLVLALALRQTGSLWACIALHVAVNSVAIAGLHFGG